MFAKEQARWKTYMARGCARRATDLEPTAYNIMRTKLESIKTDYQDLGEGEKILFLQWVSTTDKYKYEYATMPDSLRKFYDPKAAR